MITITKQPAIFQPSDNPIIWEFTSDNPDIVYFRLELVTPSSVPFAALDIFPTPANPTKGFANVSAILKNYVKHQFKSYSLNPVDTFPNSVFAYRVYILERVNDNGTIVDGEGYYKLSDDFTFNAKLDNITFKNYNINNYIVNSLFQIQFLTSKPDRQVVNDYSNEGLFFLQNNFSNNISVAYEFFDKSGTNIGNYTVALSNQSTIKQYRINCSIGFLKELLPLIDFSTLNYYTVNLIDSTSTIRSEKKTFLYKPLPCHLFPVNIVWANKFGCLDTFQLYQPESNFTAEKSTIKHNQYKFNTSGNLTSYESNVFNVVDEIINSTTQLAITLNTQPLSDAEQTWLSGLVSSKQIYLQLDSDFYVPVTITDSSYNIKSRKYQSEQNIKQFTFKLADGFTGDMPLVNLNN